jgi:hypothetical protein
MMLNQMNDAENQRLLDLDHRLVMISSLKTIEFDWHRLLPVFRLVQEVDQDMC